MTARDEGAGTMEDREEWRSQILIAVLDAMRSWRGHTPERVAIEITEAVIALAAPVSAPGMDREAVITIISDAMDSAIPEPWEVASLAADRILALAKGQKATAPADGSQVEPSTTGAGRQIIPTDDQGGEG